MIVRTPRKERFTIIDNRILEDERISMKAKGFLCYLLSRPDNWSVNDEYLSTVGPDGEAATRSALKELENAGYLVRRKERGARGKFVWVTYVYDAPQTQESQVDSPQVGFPPVDYPPVGYPPVENPPVINTDVTKTEKQLLPESRPSSSPGFGDVVKRWEQNMSVLTPILADSLHDLVEEYGPLDVMEAIRIAKEARKTDVRYVRGILRRGINERKPVGTPAVVNGSIVANGEDIR